MFCALEQHNSQSGKDAQNYFAEILCFLRILANTEILSNTSSSMSQRGFFQKPTRLSYFCEGMRRGGRREPKKCSCLLEKVSVGQSWPGWLSISRDISSSIVKNRERFRACNRFPQLLELPVIRSRRVTLLSDLKCYFKGLFYTNLPHIKQPLKFFTVQFLIISVINHNKWIVIYGHTTSSW